MRQLFKELSKSSFFNHVKKRSAVQYRNALSDLLRGDISHRDQPLKKNNHGKTDFYS
jgi:hypothetical protein